MSAAGIEHPCQSDDAPSDWRRRKRCVPKASLLGRGGMGWDGCEEEVMPCREIYTSSPIPHHLLSSTSNPPFINLWSFWFFDEMVTLDQ
eukprot:scaffold4011_cov115-Alexandrium_tamarense.AAC.8